MSKAALSESIQDYLKSVYKLQALDGRVTIGALAKDQSVSPASASAMVKKLAALGLLEHEKYRGAQLTERGRAGRARGDPPPPPARALPRGDARRSHVDDVHDEADRLEHVISEELEARIDQRARLPDARPARRPDPGRQPELARRADAPRDEASGRRR